MCPTHIHAHLLLLEEWLWLAIACAFVLCVWITMLSVATNMHMAFAAPAFAARAPTAQVRLTTSLMVDDWSAPQATETKPTSMDTTEMVGKVTPPTGGMPTGGVAAPVEPTTIGPADFIRLGAFGPPRFTSNTWNPKNLAVPALPKQAELFSKQFQPNYLKVTPDYLDGTLPGDQGFDPWEELPLTENNVKDFEKHYAN
eukprot:1346943-Prymnesium_polylepis.1